MKVYGRPQDITQVCPDCKAGLGYYCGYDAGGLQVCESRALPKPKENAADVDRS